MIPDSNGSICRWNRPGGNSQFHGAEGENSVADHGSTGHVQNQCAFDETRFNTAIDNTLNNRRRFSNGPEHGDQRPSRTAN